MTDPILPPPLRDAGPLETMARATHSALMACKGIPLAHCEAGARRAIAALTEAGYAIVPTEPTEAMVEAGNATDMIDVPDCDPPVELPDTWAIYRAMIAAAPPLNTKEGE